MQTISIIGAGRLGGALAVALGRKAFAVENLIARDPDKARRIADLIEPPPQILAADKAAIVLSEIVIIATPDAAIEATAAALARELTGRPFVFHTSGALSSEVLESLRQIGCRTGSIHPLVSISDPVLGANRFKKAYFCLEGETEAVETARSLVEALEGVPFSIETRFKTLYHAAAVTACGHLVALIDIALEMLENCGLERAAAQRTLLPLIRSTVENLETQTTSEALTGTFARADLGTFRRHLEVIGGRSSAEALEIYLQLGARSAHLAEMQGANRENLEEILRQISLAKRNLKC